MTLTKIANLFKRKRESHGEPANLPNPGEIRIKSTYNSSKRVDFNTWANHIHSTVRNNHYGK
jgi:hypothetical protein